MGYYRSKDQEKREPLRRSLKRLRTVVGGDSTEETLQNAIAHLTDGERTPEEKEPDDDLHGDLEVRRTALLLTQLANTKTTPPRVP